VKPSSQLNVISDQASLAYALANEEPAGDLYSNNNVQCSLSNRPVPESLFLKICHLDGQVIDSGGELGRRGRGQLYLGISHEYVQLGPGQFLGCVEEGGSFLDEGGHGSS